MSFTEYFEEVYCNVFDIEWDTDNYTVDLPESLYYFETDKFAEDSEEDFEERLADNLSNSFGWSIKSFSYEII